MPTGDVSDNAVTLGGLHAAEEDEKKHDLALVRSKSREYEDSPSEEDLASLRRVADHVSLSLFTIAFVEACERFSYYGTVIVFTNFIQQPLPPGSNTGAGGKNGQSGALGMSQRAAVGITTFNQFWQYTMPLFGSWVADKYWGRYKTITWALGIDLIGHLILVMSAIPPVITKPHSSLAAMIVAVIVIGFGTGGFKPNISPLIVEQLPNQRLRVTTLPSGERVIVDPAITIERVYNWFYMFINVGALIGQISMSFAEKYVGFWLAYMLPTIMLSLCPLVMIWGRKRYVRRAPAGSVLGPAVKTFMLAQKGRWSLNPFTTWKNMHDGTFWQKVKPSSFAPGTKPAWMTFDDAWVEELRRGFAACSVFCWYPIYWLTYNQLNNNLVSQAATLQLHGLPNEIVSNLDPLALIIFIPICDFGLYPLLRRWKIRFTPIRKIFAGFMTGALAMVYSCVLQYYIYKQSDCGHYPSTCDTKPNISVWVQSGAYILIALSEIFASITSLEYAYSKAPTNMRSMVQAVSLFTSAISAAIGQAWVSLSEDPLLVWNYGSVGVLAFIAGILFWFQYRHLDDEEDQLNDLAEGNMNADAPAPVSQEKASA
ncbi:hypothetical protein TD95_002530 [Thielaviopsis punctulata]|uniref:Major facilitator superfamily (MFS) profile domain-containing protein n=1 Tax=Thielaviopsis punctulata TaxID=72032 RepID=A0A0F4ZCZ3_9PEZI|nr:hypothetical protein TD95_002530 [Thielaviopsis punctulata]